MGFIVLGQSEFLRFTPKDKTNTIVACFLTALLEIGIFAGLKYWEYRQEKGSIDQP